jgi:hypothetical protein
MSHSYYVSPPTDPARWSQPADEFEQRLRVRWPDARIRLLAVHVDEPNAVEWEVPMTHNLLMGKFARDGTYIVLRGDVRDCAEVAVWFREIVPEVQPLIFFNEGYTAQVDLHRGIKSAEVAAPFLEQ